MKYYCFECDSETEFGYCSKCLKISEVYAKKETLEQIIKRKTRLYGEYCGMCRDPRCGWCYP